MASGRQWVQFESGWAGGLNSYFSPLRLQKGTAQALDNCDVLSEPGALQRGIARVAITGLAHSGTLTDPVRLVAAFPDSSNTGMVVHHATTEYSWAPCRKWLLFAANGVPSMYTNISFATVVAAAVPTLSVQLASGDGFTAEKTYYVGLSTYDATGYETGLDIKHVTTTTTNKRITVTGTGRVYFLSFDDGDGAWHYQGTHTDATPVTYTTWNKSGAPPLNPDGIAPAGVDLVAVAGERAWWVQAGSTNRIYWSSYDHPLHIGAYDYMELNGLEGPATAIATTLDNTVCVFSRTNCVRIRNAHLGPYDFVMTEPVSIGAAGRFAVCNDGMGRIVAASGNGVLLWDGQSEPQRISDPVANYFRDGYGSGTYFDTAYVAYDPALDTVFLFTGTAAGTYEYEFQFRLSDPGTVLFKDVTDEWTSVITCVGTLLRRNVGLMPVIGDTAGAVYNWQSYLATRDTVGTTFWHSRDEVFGIEHAPKRVYSGMIIADVNAGDTITVKWYCDGTSQTGQCSVVLDPDARAHQFSFDDDTLGSEGCPEFHTLSLRLDLTGTPKIHSVWVRVEGADPRAFKSADD